MEFEIELWIRNGISIFELEIELPSVELESATESPNANSDYSNRFEGNTPLISRLEPNLNRQRRPWNVNRIQSRIVIESPTQLRGANRNQRQSPTRFICKIAFSRIQLDGRRVVLSIQLTNNTNRQTTKTLVSGVLTVYTYLFTVDKGRYARTLTAHVTHVKPEMNRHSNYIIFKQATLKLSRQ